MLALAGGYYAGRFARGVYLTRAAGSSPAAVEEDAPDRRRRVCPAPPLLTVDPDAPLPTTVEALNQETLRAVEGLTQLFPDNPDALEMKARVQVVARQFVAGRRDVATMPEAQPQVRPCLRRHGLHGRQTRRA